MQRYCRGLYLTQSTQSFLTPRTNFVRSSIMAKSAEEPVIQSVYEVKYAERIVKKSDVLNDYDQYGLPDGDLHMNYNFWVIRTADKIILVDTGYDVAKFDWLGEISVTPTPEAL